MESFSIRPAEDKDINVIMYLESTCFVAPWGLEDIKYELSSNPVSNVWVIENSQGTVLGFIDYWITFDSATVCQICINPMFRKMGLGTILLNEMIKDCKANRVRNITLEVRENNLNAINLYEKVGFKKILVKKEYYTNGDNAIYMVKEIGGNDNGDNLSNRI